LAYCAILARFWNAFFWMIAQSSDYLLQSFSVTEILEGTVTYLLANPVFHGFSPHVFFYSYFYILIFGSFMLFLLTFLYFFSAHYAKVRGMPIAVSITATFA
jgi:hypothetical protein